MALRDLSVKINANTTGFQRGLKQVQSGVKGLSKSMLAMAGVAVGVAGALALARKSFKDFLNLQSSITRVGNLFGESAKYVKYFAETTAKSLGMSESVAYQYASTYGNIFKNLTKDSQENAKLTIAMLKASAVIASKTSFSMDTVMDKLRSGIMGATQAIDDLGINVKIKMLEMTDAFKRISNGRSWEKLTFEEQQQIRMLGILEQAQKTYGDSVQKGGVYSMSLLKGAFKDLSSYAGAFIYSALKPLIGLLTQLAFAASTALKSLAALFGLEVDLSGMDGFNDVTGAVVDDVDDLNDGLEKAKKKIQKLASFDQINVLPSDSGSDKAGSGGLAGGGSVFDDLAMPEFDLNPMDTSKFENGLKNLKDKIAAFIEDIKNMFNPSIKAWGKAFNSLKDPIKNAADSIGNTFTNLWTNTLKPFGGYLVGDFVPSIVNSISTNLAPIFSDVASVVVGEFAKDFEFTANKISKIVDDVFLPAFELIKDVTVDVLESTKENWDEYGESILENFVTFRDGINDTWNNLYDSVLSPVFEKLFDTLRELWDNHLKPLWDNISEFAMAFAETALTLWNKVLKPVIDWLVEVLKPIVMFVFDSVIDAFKIVFAVFSDILGGIFKALKGLLNFITGVLTGDWQKAWGGIKDFFVGIWDAIWGAVKYVVNLIILGLNTLWRGVYSVFAGIMNGAGKLAEGIGKLFGKDWGFSMPSSPPTIPYLAKGGIATGATLAVIGEAGKEAVLPLENNTGWMDTLAKKISGTGGETTVHLSVYLDDGTLIDEFTRRISRNGQRFDRLPQGV